MPLKKNKDRRITHFILNASKIIIQQNQNKNQNQKKIKINGSI
jgi:hypothetical protein